MKPKYSRWLSTAPALGEYIPKAPIKDAEADFEKTKLECSEITLEAYKKIPKYIRFIGWLFRILAPLM
ncbi:hypothetical protein [Treponema sp.]|uniref:hypothetical protein n=1 Tax=Treponema sp. TaxID=166 RepID=UPI003EFC29E4